MRQLKHSLWTDRCTWCSEGGELVEEVRVFLLAAHSTHSANVQRQVPDQLACGQLVHLQDVLHVMEVVDQQVVLVHTGDKACRRIEKGSERKLLKTLYPRETVSLLSVFISMLLPLSTASLLILCIYLGYTESFHKAKNNGYGYNLTLLISSVNWDVTAQLEQRVHTGMDYMDPVTGTWWNLINSQQGAA